MGQLYRERRVMETFAAPTKARKRANSNKAQDPGYEHTTESLKSHNMQTLGLFWLSLCVSRSFGEVIGVFWSL